MGSPIHATPADRLATRKLASAVLEAIREDEAMPHGLDSEGSGRHRVFNADDAECLHEDVESHINWTQAREGLEQCIKEQA